MNKILTLAIALFLLSCSKDEQDKQRECLCTLYTYELKTFFNPVRTEWVLVDDSFYSNNCQDQDKEWQQGLTKFKVQCQ